MPRFKAENRVTVEVIRRMITIKSIDHPQVQMVAVLTDQMMVQIAEALQVKAKKC